MTDFAAAQQRIHARRAASAVQQRSLALRGQAEVGIGGQGGHCQPFQKLAERGIERAEILPHPDVRRDCEFARCGVAVELAVRETARSRRSVEPCRKRRRDVGRQGQSGHLGLRGGLLGT